MALKVIQWSTGNVGTLRARGASSTIPSSSSSGVWVHEPDEGRAGRRRALRAPADDRRARDERRRRAPRARRRLRLLHRDRRPAPVRGDRGHLPHPRRGQERGVELGRAARAPEVASSPRCATSSRRRAATGRVVVLHLGHRPGLRQRRPAARRSPACASSWEEIRIQEIINYATYDQPQVLFETMGFGKPLDHDAAAAHARARSRSPGAAPSGCSPRASASSSTRSARCYERRPADRADPHRRAHRRAGHDGARCASRCRASSAARRRSSSSTSRASTTRSRRSGRRATAATACSSRACPRCAASSSSRTSTATTPSAACVLTATRIVNAIPAVCAAPPGLLSALDLPLVTGKGLFVPPRAQ